MNEIERDKLEEYKSDMTEEGVSSCCGAAVIMDMCQACYEHCSIEYPEAEDDEEVELLREALKKKKND